MPSPVVLRYHYCSLSSIMVHASCLGLASREVSPPRSSATAATLDFLGMGWLDRPPSNLNNFLWMVLTRISFWQCLYPWFFRVHFVHCQFAFRSSATIPSIPVCASAQTRSIIFGRGAVFSFTPFSSFFFAWYTLFSLAVFLGFVVAFAVIGSSHCLGPFEFEPEKLMSLMLWG